MNRILIAYASHSGSTQEVASFLGKCLSAQNLDVDVKPMKEVFDLSSYDFIIAGGLLYRFGWHPEIIRFLQSNLTVLKQKKVALFVTGLRLIKTPDCDRAGYPVYVDLAIQKPVTGGANARQQKGLLDGYTTMKGYLQAALPTIESIRPVSLAFFAGKLDLHTLALPEKLIMMLLMLLTGKKPGDSRNWDAIGAWVDGLNLVPSFVDSRVNILASESA